MKLNGNTSKRSAAARREAAAKLRWYRDFCRPLSI